MKKKIGRRETSTVESAKDRRVKEDPPLDAALAPRASTFNAQRSTPNLPTDGFAAANVQLPSNARFDLEERLLEFSARIIRLVDALPNTRAASHLAGQLLRCGTSSYGNHGEVEAAESRRDFIHKLKICLKELKETRRWLRLEAKPP